MDEWMDGLWVCGYKLTGVLDKWNGGQAYGQMTDLW